jgi:hypothetical protein
VGGNALDDCLAVLCGDRINYCIKLCKKGEHPVDAKAQNLARLHDLGLVAVIRGPSPELTLKLVDALVRSGVTGIEITFTTPNALQVTQALHQQYGDTILLGDGHADGIRAGRPGIAGWCDVSGQPAHRT